MQMKWERVKNDKAIDIVKVSEKNDRTGID